MGGVHLEVSTYGRPLHIEAYFDGDVLYTVCVLECSSIYYQKCLLMRGFHFL